MTAETAEATIINVNDHEGARYMTTITLRRAGFQVVEARNGLEALDQLSRHHPALVVLDVNLPDIDGYEVCRRIRENPKTAQAKILHTSGTFVTVKNRVQSLEGGADGYLTQPFEPQELIAIIRSLLRLQRAEDELRAHSERLKEADRRKDEFLAMLAHELRNPLAVLTTSIPLVERRPPMDDIERRSRDVIKRQTLHLSRLIDDLLDVARVTQGKIDLRQEIIDLRELLTRVTSTTRSTRVEARKQVLALSVPPTPAFVRGDVTRLEQIFMNLLDNASKYTDPGGQIFVSVEVDQSRQPSVVRATVRDTGIGIAPETLPAVFSLFAQAGVSIARSRGGLGIGLTLVRTLVELHGGRVEANSPGLGNGSEFIVELPAAEAQAQLPCTTQAGNDESKGFKVLIIEDNIDAQQALADLCELWGHRTATASDGVEGVNLALADHFDVAVVDVGLPLLDGYGVARRIRASPHGRSMRLIALTGYGAPEQKAEALAAGFDLHLVKPAKPEQLRELLNDLSQIGNYAAAKANAS